MNPNGAAASCDAPEDEFDADAEEEASSESEGDETVYSVDRLLAQRWAVAPSGGGPGRLEAEYVCSWIPASA